MKYAIRINIDIVDNIDIITQESGYSVPCEWGHRSSSSIIESPSESKIQSMGEDELFSMVIPPFPQGVAIVFPNEKEKLFFGAMMHEVDPWEGWNEPGWQYFIDF